MRTFQVSHPDWPCTRRLLIPSCVWLEGYPVSRVLFIGFLELCTHQNWLDCQSSPNAGRNSATLIGDGLVGSSLCSSSWQHRYPELDLLCMLRLILLLAH